MTFNIDEWLNLAVEKLQSAFGENLLFIGLQGSYNRDEATPESDIDLVVILDNMTFEDLKLYRSIIDTMPYKEKACGFISGKNEIQKWSKSDLFQFFYDTKSLFGHLENIIQPPTKNAIKQFVKSSFENLYHVSVHSFIHSKNYIKDLQKLYKMTFFILQAKYFIETNKYIPTKNQLFELLDDIDKEILDICIKKDFVNDNIENLYYKIIRWCLNNM